MPDERLSIFISYATEDRVLATEIAEELRRSFGPAALKVYIDVEFTPGVNWRDRLMEDLNNTDVLLIVATGKQKVSHSFTGFEVGYFSNSITHSKKMASFPTQDRFILPIAVFTKTPETVGDIQSLQVTLPFEPVIVDPLGLREATKPAESSSIRKHPVFKLFKRIQGIINESVSLNDEELEALGNQFQDSAGRLIDIIHNELRQRVFHENFPERKIIIRTPVPPRNSRQDEMLSKASVEFFGRFDAFGFDAPRTGEIAWPEFTASIQQDEIARSWTTTVQMLVTAALRGDFRDNRQTVTSRDKDRAFRMFVARSVIYFSTVHEIHIYIVEIKYKDFGDPTTTMLLKAISLGLQYRFMFLEGKTSEFSPECFNATLPDEFRGKVAEMRQQLDYLLWFSNEAGLRRADSIILLLGELASGEIESRAAAWEAAKAKLYSSADKVLASADDRELLQNKPQFVATLKEFCENTRVMNAEFTSKTLSTLESVVSEKADPKPGAERAA